MATVSDRHAGGRPRTLESCELGHRIERFAAKAGLHLDELASRAGLTYQCLYQIRVGKTRRPSVATLAAVAKALGISIDKLTDGLF
jgi:transcriptional regulator with XRE-family HTH domain